MSDEVEEGASHTPKEVAEMVKRAIASQRAIPEAVRSLIVTPEETRRAQRVDQLSRREREKVAFAETVIDLRITLAVVCAMTKSPVITIPLELREAFIRLGGGLEIMHGKDRKDGQSVIGIAGAFPTAHQRAAWVEYVRGFFAERAETPPAEEKPLDIPAESPVDSAP